MSTQPTEESLAMTTEKKESVRSEATLDPTTTTTATTITVTPLESPGPIDAVHSTTSTPTTAASEEDPPDMIRTESYRNSLTEGGDRMATPARASTHNSSEEEEGEDSEEETMPTPPQHRAPPTISAPSLNSLSSDVAIGVITLKIKRSKFKECDLWLADIRLASEQFKGFVRGDRQDWVIDEKYVGVSILLHFESDEDLLRWNSSTVRLSKIEAAKKLGLFADRRVGIKDKAVPFVQITRFESSACKSPRVLPPPKWKLWLVIWGCVATTSLAASEAAVARGLRHGGWLEYEPALFIQLLLTVTLIIFAYSPLLISINIYGFGLAAWLKLPRLKVSTKPGKRFINLRVIIAGILEVMNSGFSLLNPPIESGGSPELKARFSKLEGRLDALKRHTVGQAHGNGHGHPRSPRTSTLGLDENPAMKRASIVESYAKNVLARIPSASKRDPNEPITITTHHRVRWECIEEFEEWQADIVRAMTHWEGYVSARRVVPTRWDDNLFTLIFRFTSVETLSAWMHSDVRIQLLTDVQPLLQAPDKYEATQNRQLPDAFSDVFVGQGLGVSRRPHPKWKVVVITTIALFFTSWSIGWHLPRHLIRWGVEHKHGRIVVMAGFSTCVNTYLTAPFFYNLFGYWLDQPVPSHFQWYPWRLFDVGLKSPYTMALWVFLYFLGCGLKIDAD